MKNCYFITTLFLISVSVGCSPSKNTKDIEDQISKLEKKQINLLARNAELQETNTQLIGSVKLLGNAVETLRHIQHDLNTEYITNTIYLYDTNKYILTLKLKESSFTLNIGKHIKNSMNAITFELPVDKRFYDEVSVGNEIIDEFKTASFWLKGNIGSYHMIVEKKTIRR